MILRKTGVKSNSYIVNPLCYEEGSICVIAWKFRSINRNCGLNYWLCFKDHRKCCLESNRTCRTHNCYYFFGQAKPRFNDISPPFH